MIQQVERRTCDECKKTEEQAGIRIGGSQFAGWIQVQRVAAYGSMAHAPVDFCGAGCCAKHMNRLHVEEQKLIRDARRQTGRLHRALKGL